MELTNEVNANITKSRETRNAPRNNPRFILPFVVWREEETESPVFRLLTFHISLTYET